MARPVTRGRSFHFFCGGLRSSSRSFYPMSSHGTKRAIASRFEITTARSRHGRPGRTTDAWTRPSSGCIAPPAIQRCSSKRRSRHSAAFPSETHRVSLASAASQPFHACWIRRKPGRAPQQTLHVSCLPTDSDIKMHEKAALGVLGLVASSALRPAMGRGRPNMVGIQSGDARTSSQCARLATRR